MDDPEKAVPQDQWQVLEARWRTLLGLEATIDSTRMGTESLRLEMEAAFRNSLNVEDKVHGLQADVAQWNKAKNRVHYTLPKLREYVHRATWALGMPERKSLEAIFKNNAETDAPLPDLQQVSAQLDFLQKDRQVLVVQGNTITQECRNICGEIRSALATLQRNAASRARASRDAKREKR